MFSTFFSREFLTGLRRPMVYLFMLMVGLLVFGATVSDNVIIGRAVGDVYKNAPSEIGIYVSVLSVFGLLFAAAFFNNAALRDYRFKFNEILFSTPLSKAGYFFGRFAGAWLLASMVMVGVYLGVALGSVLGPAFDWIAPERIGPIPWEAFLNSFLLFVLPNMLLAGSLIFLLATQFRSTVISFVGALLILVGYIIAIELTSDIDNQSLAALVDMFGFTAYNLDIQYYSPAELNATGPGFRGHLLKNRLLWTAVGMGILLLAYARFSFATKSRKRVRKAQQPKAQLAPQFNRPTLSGSVDKISPATTFFSFFRINLLSMVRSTTFIILLLFSLIMLVSNLWGGFEYFGLQSYPVTYKMLDEVNNLSTLFVFIVLIFFSGELVWRDRDNHLNEVIDGTPHRSLVSLVAKMTALVTLAVLLHLTLIGVAVLYQALHGYTRFELDVYFIDFLTGALPAYITWAAVSIFLQVIINNKYIGYFVTVLLLFVWDLVLGVLEIETRMLSVGSRPSIPYSDMNGFGPVVEGKFWFNGYWVLFGVLTLVLAGLAWPRGMGKSLRERFSLGRKALGRSYYLTLGLVSIGFLAVAGFVFYNTQLLNPYDTSKESELMRVDYERQYGKYRDAPNPHIVSARYFIDIYPENRTTRGRAELTLTNKHRVALDTLRFTLDESYNHRLEIPGADLAFEDEELDFVMYALDRPLAPGDSMELVVHFGYEPKGFENSVSNRSILRNGTFFNNFSILPGLGYSEQYEISDKNDRRKYGLPPKRRMPQLRRNCGELCMNNYLSNGTSDWVEVETFISTDEDQIAIAPGSLVSQQSENGRTLYHYKVDHPSQNFYAFISAEFEVARRKWRDVDLEVYYHPEHDINVERMLDAIEKSLVYYTENFGPYYHKQARIIEFPRYATFAQAFPGTMPYSEAFGFIINLEDENENNVIDAVIAHEMAHQYWAHQVIGARMQGSTMLSESFAEYSALMVMKQESTPLEMKDFLKYDMQRYLRGRSRESEGELPLMRVENQGHIHYGKGAVVLYALQEYIGEDSVNAALREFLQSYRYAEPPYPTAYDFMDFLRPRIPDSLQYLITDWFEEITLYDLRMEQATAKQRPDGSYELRVEVFAEKQKADSAGNITPVPIADWVDLGFYADRDEERLLLRERVYLDQQQTELTFRLDTLPAKAAIDPLRLLIDRVGDDNVKTVDEE